MHSMVFIRVSESEMILWGRSIANVPPSGLSIANVPPSGLCEAGLSEEETSDPSSGQPGPASSAAPASLPTLSTQSALTQAPAQQTAALGSSSTPGLWRGHTDTETAYNTSRMSATQNFQKKVNKNRGLYDTD